MSELQTGIGCLIRTFLKYSSKEGDSTTLTRGELKELLQKEFGGFDKASDKEALDSLFHSMDVNADGVVDFKEYAIAVASIAILLNDSLQKKH